MNQIFSQPDPNLTIKYLSTILCSISINPEYKDFISNLQFFEFCRGHLSSEFANPTITSFSIQILWHIFTIHSFEENESLWTILISLIISKIPMKASVQFLDIILSINDNFGRLLIERFNLINLLINLLSHFSQFKLLKKSILVLLQRHQLLYTLNDQQCAEMLRLYSISLRPIEKLHRDAQKPFTSFFLTYPDPKMMDMFLQSEAFSFIWSCFTKPPFTIARKLILKYLNKIITSSPERAMFLLQKDIQGFVICGMSSISNLSQ